MRTALTVLIGLFLGFLVGLLLAEVVDLAVRSATGAAIDPYVLRFLPLTLAPVGAATGTAVLYLRTRAELDRAPEVRVRESTPGGYATEPRSDTGVPHEGLGGGPVLGPVGGPADRDGFLLPSTNAGRARQAVPAPRPAESTTTQLIPACDLPSCLLPGCPQAAGPPPGETQTRSRGTTCCQFREKTRSSPS
ncbi:DUF5957 family protein [Actinoalloteichus sp. GBA129-24]|uniref:DUF5957 family protein n=1 Tax=Actinoalloteichus sp. GBA129-24 TaxID=1612551 RepID=UPI00095084CB|nr:DUF5957 family protein [Actinoalloteichus sp. GBA129-24]APU22745.1 hypothetical protein UA75_23815 [Actinoalloteichus sp. GBA129-24]